MELNFQKGSWGCFQEPLDYANDVPVGVVMKSISMNSVALTGMNLILALILF